MENNQLFLVQTFTSMAGSLPFPRSLISELVFSACLFFQDLPQQIDDKESKTAGSSVHNPEQKTPSTDQSMKIAWRYQNQPKFEVSFCNLPSN